jgi:hypothetical protein
MNRQKQWLILTLYTAPLLLLACAPALPTATPTPRPLVPTVTPQATSEYAAKAWLSVFESGGARVQRIAGKLTKGGAGVAGAQVYSVVHDESGDRRWPAEGFVLTGSDGVALIAFSTSHAAAEERVRVEVFFLHEGKTQRAVTSFTARC